MTSKKGAVVMRELPPFEKLSALLHAVPTTTTSAAMQPATLSLNGKCPLIANKRECDEMKDLPRMDALTDETG